MVCEVAYCVNFQVLFLFCFSTLKKNAKEGIGTLFDGIWHSSALTRKIFEKLFKFDGWSSADPGRL